MDTRELVVACPLFRGIDTEELTGMLKCMSAREVSPARGEFIMSTPGTAPLMGVVLE